MADFFLEDQLQHGRAFAVAMAAKPGDHTRRHVEPTCLKHKWHHGEAGQQVVGGLRGRFPEAVMGGKIAIGRVQGGEAVVQEFEMMRLLGTDARPIGVERPRQGRVGKPRD